MTMNLDGDPVNPDAQVDQDLARLWTVDPDDDIRTWAHWCAGVAHTEGLHALLAELARRRQWMRRYAQHPPTCGVAKGERCDCGLA